jgi:adenosylhomocysteine nucleosidase
LKVLVTFAVEPEFATWRKSREFVATAVGRVTVYSSEIGGATVNVALTGMGPANARRAAEAVLTDAYALCISSGFAGALKPDGQVGDVLVARAIRDLHEGETIQCPNGLVSDASADGAKMAEMLLSSDEIVTAKEDKAHLSRLADAVDMESYTILSVAGRHGVPGVAIRAISDRFDQIIPMDFSGSVNECGQILKGKLAREIASDPSKIPALIRLGRQSRLASDRLATFLERYIHGLSNRAEREDSVGLEKVAGN